MSRGTWAILPAISALLALAPAARADGADGKDAFLKYAREAAAEKKLKICRWGSLRYRSEDAEGYFAALGADASASASQTILFASGTAHSSFVDDDTVTLNIGCAEGTPEWETLRSLELTSRGEVSYRGRSWEVSFAGGELIKLHESESNVDGSSEDDWESATRTRSTRDSESDGESRVGLLLTLPVDSSWASSYRAPTFVTFGEQRRSGPEDADLAVRAVDAADGGVRLLVDVRDDHFVPVAANANAKRFLRGDHLELWWCAGSDCVQLGVGLLANDGVDTRWLRAPRSATAAALPAVRRSGAHLEVELTPALLGIAGLAPEESWSVPFSAAFSDADDPKAGQQTIVATSELRWNAPETFGELTRVASRIRRFPLFDD